MVRKLLFLGALLVLMPLIPAVPVAAQTTARCFPETGYCIDGAIRTYWERNGGLPIFGFPIGPLKVEEVRDEQFTIVFQGPVQWFERDRLEDHSGEGWRCTSPAARRSRSAICPWPSSPSSGA